MNIKERIAMALAWRVPRRLAYWCFIRVAAHGTTGPWSHQVVPDLKVFDALERWDKKA